MPTPTSQIALGAGCFWCVEACFDGWPGIIDTVIGYGGGSYPNPTYQSVSARPGDHAELTVIYYDGAIVSLATIIDRFFKIHDPTKAWSINDKKGSLYRSVIAYSSVEQVDPLRLMIDQQATVLGKSLLTELIRLKNFAPAADKNQHYYAKNPDQPFCSKVLQPKLDRLDLHAS